MTLGYSVTIPNQHKVLRAIERFNKACRTTNTSQLVRFTGLPRNQVQDALDQLRAKHFIYDAGKGSAYHWRISSEGIKYLREIGHAEPTAR